MSLIYVNNKIGTLHKKTPFQPVIYKMTQIKAENI